jgi:hypothetical protein
LVFAAPLADDVYTLTVSRNLRDDAGNRVNGGTDYVATFILDGLPELGVWAAGTVLIDANDNYTDDGGFSGGDLAFQLGFSSDYIVAGKFAERRQGRTSRCIAYEYVAGTRSTGHRR